MRAARQGRDQGDTDGAELAAHGGSDTQPPEAHWQTPCLHVAGGGGAQGGGRGGLHPIAE
jgi:hypothetical protein